MGLVCGELILTSVAVTGLVATKLAFFGVLPSQAAVRGVSVASLSTTYMS